MTGLENSRFSDQPVAEATQIDFGYELLVTGCFLQTPANVIRRWDCGKRFGVGREMTDALRLDTADCLGHAMLVFCRDLSAFAPLALLCGNLVLNRFEVWPWPIMAGVSIPDFVVCPTAVNIRCAPTDGRCPKPNVWCAGADVRLFKANVWSAER